MPAINANHRDYQEQPTVFIATLGTRPEVVTLALDELWGGRFDEICIIHTDNQLDQTREWTTKYTMHQAVKRLDDEFVMLERIYRDKFIYVRRAQYKQDRHARPLIYRRHTITCQGKAIRDVETRAHSRATYLMLYDIFRQYKQRGATIHCCIAGGRKSMAVSAMSAAQILFDADDQMWHLVSEDEFADTDQMHEQHRHQSTVIPIETFTLTELNPIVAQLITYDTPRQAIEKRKDLQQVQEQHMKRLFVMELSERETAILRGLAAGFTNDKIDNLLPRTRTGKMLGTKKISGTIAEMYRKYMNTLGLPDDEGRWQKRTFLAIHFHDYFSTQK